MIHECGRGCKTNREKVELKWCQSGRERKAAATDDWTASSTVRVPTNTGIRVAAHN